jgi:pimeloyl-ACP methyl ester carboxylesterase
LSVVADDVVELLDALGLSTIPVIARSGGGPHALALAARHPNRVASMTVVSGAVPVSSEERPTLVAPNAGLADVLGRGREPLEIYLEALASGMLAEGPLRNRENRREALRQGIDGWVDETLALTGEWDFDVADVGHHVEWWHGAEDDVVPLSAACRLTARLPDCTLHVVPGQGHRLETATLLRRIGQDWST